MGEKGTKALVMLATLAVGNTAAGMAAKMPLLPGAGQAAVVAEAQLNIRYLGRGSGPGGVSRHRCRGRHRRAGA